MQQTFKRGFIDFRHSYRKYLTFEFIYSLLSSIMFAPLLSYIFNRLLILFKSNPNLLNNDVISFGMSFRGLIGLFLIGLCVVAILFVEFGVVIIMAHKHYFRKPVYIIASLKKAFRKLPKLLGLGTFQLFFMLLLFIPFVDAATFPTFLDINVTIVLSDLLGDSIIARIIYYVAIASLLLLFMRWIFALHFIFIKDQTVWRAMKSSWKMTKYRQLRIILSLVLLNVIIFSIGFLLITFVSQLAHTIGSKAIGDFIGNYLITFSSYFTIIMSLFLIPLNIIILTRLFYQFLANSGEKVQDELILKVGRLSQTEKRIDNLIDRRKWGVRLVLVAVLSVMFLINYTTNEAVSYLPWNIEIAAHRGDGYHSPENSMSGIRSAIEKGVDVVEVDVALTKDEVVVLSHDDDLMRTAGVPDKIEDLTYSELSHIDIGHLFDKSFTGERIPTLAEVLAVIKETDTKVIIDVKVDKDLDIYAKKIIDLIETFDAEELSLVQSFNYGFLKVVREMNEDITIGQILYLSAGNLSLLDVDFYNIRQTMLTERFIKHAKKENRDVWVWTVNQPRHIKEVLKYDIDGIITDYPERVYQLLDLN